MSNQISRSFTLITIPPRKLQDALENTIKNCQTCQERQAKLDNCCSNCRIVNAAIQRYAESNIPVKYWKLEMNRDFKGDSILLEKYKEITKDVTSTYHKGTCLCFAGKHGLGKTMVTTNILKRAAEKGYTALYTNLSDIVSNLVARDSDDKAATRKELLTVDFLVIDEFDPRHMGQSNTATDLFGRTLEDVLRTRAQNNLPLFMCTNSPNVVESFVGDIKNSISSLMNYITVVPVLGKDFRKEESK